MEQSGRFSDAILRFQEYLRVGTKLSDAEKSDADKHITDCGGAYMASNSCSVTTPGNCRSLTSQNAPVACH
jgi:hypothetical protein